MIQSAYLHTLLDSVELKGAIKLAIHDLRDRDFDSIAVTGASGVIFGSILAYELDKNLLLVRKSCESSHSNLAVEGNDAGRSYIFVDDFISTGSTLNRVVKAVATIRPSKSLVGGYLYATSHLPGWKPRAFLDGYLDVELAEVSQ